MCRLRTAEGLKPELHLAKYFKDREIYERWIEKAL
jgi:hypothetical protein